MHTTQTPNSADSADVTQSSSAQNEHKEGHRRFPLDSFQPEHLNKVLFSSCHDQYLLLKQEEETSVWTTLLAQNPDLWVFGGDNIYADTRGRHHNVWYEATPQQLEHHYKTVQQYPPFQRFQSQIPIIGVWDDHDYGIDDGDKTYKYKQQSQQAFLDFLGEPLDSPRRKQEGIYSTYLFGNPGSQVRFILLDSRYHKDPYSNANADGDFLGSAQWEWLEEVLMTTTAQFNIIVSGIQVLPNDRLGIGESWSRFPKQRSKLLQLVLDTKAKGLVFLSGDVHFAESNIWICPGRDIVEITCSGLTHSWHNQRRMKKWQQIIIRAVFEVSNRLLPFESRTPHNSYFGGEQFCGLHFDWDAQPHPIVRASVHDMKNPYSTKLFVEIPSIPANPDVPQFESDCYPPRVYTPIFRTFWIVLCLSILVCGLSVVVGCIWVAVHRLIIWIVSARPRNGSKVQRRLQTRFRSNKAD